MDVSIRVNAQTANDISAIACSIECGGHETHIQALLDGVTSVQAQMYAIIFAVYRLKYCCNVTIYTNLKFLESQWEKIKEKGACTSLANFELWEHLFFHRWAPFIKIVYQPQEVEKVREAAVNLLDKTLMQK